MGTHIQKEGLPRFYIRTLAELEDCLDVALKDKEAQKKMSKANGRALNRMKLQLRRHNKEFETKISEYRANPDAEKCAKEFGGHGQRRLGLVQRRVRIVFFRRRGH